MKRPFSRVLSDGETPKKRVCTAEVTPLRVLTFWDLGDWTQKRVLSFLPPGSVRSFAGTCQAARRLTLDAQEVAAGSLLTMAEKGVDAPDIFSTYTSRFLHTLFTDTPLTAVHDTLLPMMVRRHTALDLTRPPRVDGGRMGLSAIERRVYGFPVVVVDVDPPSYRDTRPLLPAHRFAHERCEPYGMFWRNMRDHFHYEEWSGCIAWDRFFLAGGSVLACLTADHLSGRPGDLPLSEKHDLDFFAIGSPDAPNFRESVNATVDRLRFCGWTVDLAAEFGRGYLGSSYKANVSMALADDEYKDMLAGCITMDDALLARREYGHSGGVPRPTAENTKRLSLCMHFVSTGGGATMESVLAGFDMAQCMVGYTPCAGLRCTPAATHAISTGATLYYRKDAGVIGERCAKYEGWGYRVSPLCRLLVECGEPTRLRRVLRARFCRELALLADRVSPETDESAAEGCVCKENTVL